MACEPLQLAIVAPPKSGSTFLSSLLKSLAFEAGVCRISHTSYRCSESVSVGCPTTSGPRCHRHGPRKAHGFVCTWEPQFNHSFAVKSSCCNVLRPAAASDLLDDPDLLANTNAEYYSDICSTTRATGMEPWLSKRPQSWAWAASGRDLNASGFVVGPIRVLPSIAHALRPRLASSSGGTSHGPRALAALASLHSLAWATSPSPSSRAPTIVLHMRHPVEMLVSHVFCITSPRVCPRRHALLAAANRSRGGASSSSASSTSTSARVVSSVRSVPGVVPGTSSIDDLLLSELYGPADTSVNRLLERVERLASWLAQARALEARGLAEVRELSRIEARGDFNPMLDTWEATCSSLHATEAAVGDDRGDEAAEAAAHGRQRLGPRPLVLLSYYETMVRDFDAWLEALLDSLPDGVARVASRAQMHKALVALFQHDFVADGKHKHSLVPGSNLARLQPATLLRLQGHARLSSVVERLGYEWPHIEMDWGTGGMRLAGRR